MASVRAPKLGTIPDFAIEFEDDIEKFSPSSWFNTLTKFGEELFNEATTPSNLNRVIALSLPTRELAVTAISLGIIHANLEQKMNSESNLSKISIHQIEQGMTISGFSGDARRPFLAEVIQVTDKTVQLRPNKSAPSMAYLKSKLSDLELVAKQGTVELGILPANQDDSSKFWEKFLKQAPTADIYQTPVINLVGSKSDIDFEMKLNFTLRWPGGEIKSGAVSNILCPIKLADRPPYFTRINNWDDSDLVMEDSTECLINIYPSFNSIKNNLSPRNGGLNLFIVGRNDLNAKTCASLIEGKYAHSPDYEVQFASLRGITWAEVLTYGVKK